jgi:hypothetical protein
MYTVNFFNSFLCAVAESKDMKPYFLRALGEVFVLHLDRSDELAELGIFKVIFSHFNGLSLSNRIYVLRLLKRVLSASSVSHFSLQDDEIRAYIALLRYPTRRSTVILICLHMCKLMEQKRLSRARLRELGLVDVILQHLEQSPGSQPVFESSNAVGDPVAEEDPDEEEERSQCLELISRLERKAQLSVIADISSSSPALPPVSTGQQSYLLNSLPMLRPLPAATRVSYCIKMIVLDLARSFLQENSLGQDEFRTRGGLQLLYSLLNDRILRRPALDVVSSIAIADVLAPPVIFSEYFDLLEKYASGDETASAVRSEILSSIRNMFMRSDGTKTAFRACGCVERVISILNGLANQALWNKDQDEDFSVSYSLELMDILAWTWRNHPAGLQYFRTKPGLFSSFRLALINSPLSKDTQLHGRLADALVGMSLPAGWPPACRVHAGLTANRFRASGAGSALSVARERSQTCLQCRELLVIENPEMLKLLIEFIVQREAESAADSASDTADTAFILTLKSIKFLVEVTPLNAQVLSKSGLVLYILENLRPILLKDATTSSRARSRQPLLLGLVERVSQFSMSALEFRKFLELLRSPSCPTNILSSLCAIAQRPVTPAFFVLFQKRKPGSIRIPDVGAPVPFRQSTTAVPGPAQTNPTQAVLWPPVSGYAVSVWFSVESYGDSNTDRSVVLLFSLEASYPTGTLGKPRFRLDAFLYKGILTVRTAVIDDSPVLVHDASSSGGSSGSLGSITTHTFNELFFEEKQWYHLVLSHQASPAAQMSNKQNVGDGPSSKGELSIWVDGKCCDVAFNANSSGSSTNPRLVYPVSAVATSVQFTAGNTVGSSALDDKGVSNATWAIGNIIVFDCCLKSFEPFLLFMMGPNYVGGLEGLRCSTFFVNEVVSPSYLTSVEGAADIVQHPSNYTLSHLHNRMLFLFSPRDNLYSRSPSSSFVAAKGSPLDRTTLLDAAATTSGDFVSCQRTAVKDVLSSIGGVGAILYLIASAATEENQRLSLELLRCLLEWSAVNLHQMIRCNGYEILARIMRRREWLLSESVLDLAFSLVGLSKSKKRGTFSEGMIKNVEALHFLLLDWKIWSRAPEAVRVLLFRSLAEVASISEHAQFNVSQLRTVKIRTLILMMLEEDDFPVSVAHHVVRLLQCLMHDPWNVADIKAIFRFVVATHPGPGPKLMCPLGIDRHKTVFFSGITSGSRPTLSRLKASSSMQFTEFDGSLSESWSDLGDLEPPNSADSITRRPVRDLVFTMLVDCMSTGATAVRSQFFELCTMEVMFALLNTPCESSRVLVLRLFEIFLRDVPSAVRFKKCYGFALLGDILQSYCVSEDVVCVLLCIMLGRTYTPGQTLSAIFSTPLAPVSSDRGLLSHADIVVSLLGAMCSCHTPASLKHNTVKFLHDLYSRDISIKEAMTATGMIQSLAQTIVFEWEHKVARAYHVLADSADHSVEEIRSQVILGSEDLIDLEEDAINLLRAVALFGCTSPESTGPNMLRDILVTLQALPVPLSYIHRLQKRIIHDVLEFFLENSRGPVSQTSDSLRALKTVLTANFSKVAVIAVGHWILMLQPSFPGIEVGPLSPRRSVVLSPPSPTKPLSRSSSSSSFLRSPPESPSQRLRAEPLSPNSPNPFHEILEPFDGPIIPKELDVNDASIPTHSESETDLVNRPTAQPHLGVRDETASKSPSGPFIEPDEPITSPWESQETKASESADLLSAAISEQMAEHGRSFVSDSRLFNLLVDSLLEFTQARSQTSPFKRLRQALKRKTVGVSSMTDVESDLSWHLEKLIFHTLQDLKDLEHHQDTFVVALERGAALSREDLFFSETEYLARFLHYTYPLLSSASDRICETCWSVWKKLLLETPTKLISKVILFTANSSLLSYGRGDETKLQFASGISDLVSKVESADLALRRQWNATFALALKDSNQSNAFKVASVKQLVSSCSTKIIEVQQIIIKPLIEFMRSSSDREKKIRSSWRQLIKRLTHERGSWPLHRSLIRWELDSTESPMRVRLRLKPRRAHKHPILGSDTNPFLERSMLILILGRLKS